MSKAGQNVANFYQSFTSDLSISSFLNFAKQFYVTFIYHFFVTLFFREFFFITKEMTQGARRGGCYSIKNIISPLMDNRFPSVCHLRQCTVVAAPSLRLYTLHSLAPITLPFCVLKTENSHYSQFAASPKKSRLTARTFSESETLSRRVFTVFESASNLGLGDCMQFQ